MASDLFLSNSVSGFDYNEETFTYNFVSETSVHGTSGTRYSLGQVPRSGKIVQFEIGVVAPAVSASGFVSGTVGATLRVNSAAVCSTDPSIDMVGSAGAVARKTSITSAAGVIPAAINAASATVNKGDDISLDFNARSVGSGAATSAGVGFYATVRVRYDAL